MEATLKHVWQSTNLPAQFRVKMATQGLTELSSFAGISDTLTGFKESISTFFEESGRGYLRIHIESQRYLSPSTRTTVKLSLMLILNNV